MANDNPRTKLTAKQERFCLAYLKLGNASEAYRQAYSTKGMTPKTINEKASRLLAMGKIRARLEELNQSAVTDAVMTRQEALERLSNFARADLADLVEFGSYELGEVDGEPVIQSTWKIRDSALQDANALSAIAELNASKDGIKIKTHSPLQALQQLAKMQGWESAQKHDHISSDGSMTPKPTTIQLVAPNDDSDA
ncbi:terminase small subunit [Vreelandella venusta]|uniref:terminase small subunit n=1 Tax=Vreelandella venusta TaxID=44935 RepID=UPI0018DAC0DE|nr:terminase small subunit [Halomonas venusta]QPI62426.1 terminase small subunit [Halomonas venusta]